MGLSLSYALPITGLLSGLLTSSAETEQEMVAVERIAEYCHFQPQVGFLDAVCLRITRCGAVCLWCVAL